MTTISSADAFDVERVPVAAVRPYPDNPQRRPNRSAAMTVVPLPLNGSHTQSPGALEYRIGRPIGDAPLRRRWREAGGTAPEVVRA